VAFSGFLNRPSEPNLKSQDTSFDVKDDSTDRNVRRLVALKKFIARLNAFDGVRFLTCARMSNYFSEEEQIDS